MTHTTVHRFIEAPVSAVFDTIAHIDNFSKAIPDITNVEFLTEARTGVGTRFKETRNMNGRLATVELEVAEYEENRRVRFVSDAGGTIWDTIFMTTAAPGGTNMKMVMEAKPYRVLAKLANPFMRGLIRKAVERDMDAVKAYCEKHS